MEKENEQLNNGVKNIQNIKMTESEKSQIFQSILSSAKIQEIKKEKKHNVSQMFPNYSFYMRIAVYFILLAGVGGLFIANYPDSKKDVALYKKQNTPNKNIVYNLNNTNIINKKTETDNTTLAKIDNNKSTISQGNTTTTTSHMMTTTAIPFTSYPENDKYIEIARIAFVNWFESEAEKIGYVLDYRIEDIEFIALKSNAVEPQKSWFLPGVSNESFMVYVKYSVKTTDEGKKYQWLAGNGEDSPEGWVLNKTLFVTIDKYNSVYKVVNAGTSP